MATEILPAPSRAELPVADPPLWRDLLFWLTLGLSLFAVTPFLLPGYFWGANDARHHVYFLFEYDRLVQDGIWWPRWSPDFAFGYGYPFFNIYGPFSHFLAELLLHFGKLRHTAAVESIFAFSIVASAGAMYAFVRSWSGRGAALIAGLAYVYVPYHLLNLYVRANLAESMAFVWLPLCLWTARQSVVRPSIKWIVGLALSYAGLMVTSNLVIVLFTPVLAGYLLVLTVLYAVPEGVHRQNLTWPKRFGWWIHRCLAPAAGIVAGLGLSAAFWLPAFLERQSVRVDQWFDGRYDYQGHFVYFHQFFSPSWGFGVSVPGPNDPISFQIGAVVFTFAVLGVLMIWRSLGRLRWELALFIVAGVAAAFVASQFAVPLWNLPIVGGLLQTAQFPWRWLVISALSASILSGLVAHPLLLPRNGLSLALVVLAALVIVGSYPYLQVQISEPAEGPVTLAGLMRFQQSSDEMTGSTAWVKEIPTWSPMADYYISQDKAGGPVQACRHKAGLHSIRLSNTWRQFGGSHHVSEEIYYFNGLETPQTIRFNQFYYPGWNAYLLDGEHGARTEQVPITPETTGTLGRMTVQVPPGEGYLLLVFEDTPPRTVGGIISLATAAVLVVAGIVAAWRRRTAAARMRR